MILSTTTIQPERRNVMSILELKEFRDGNRNTVRKYYNQLRGLRGYSISQKEIAVAARVPAYYISAVENGRTLMIGDSALERILAVYKELNHGNELAFDVGGSRAGGDQSGVQDVA
jgi:hypothetical protein